MSKVTVTRDDPINWTVTIPIPVTMTIQVRLSNNRSSERELPESTCSYSKLSNRNLDAIDYQKSHLTLVSEDTCHIFGTVTAYVAVSELRIRRALERYATRKMFHMYNPSSIRYGIELITEEDFQEELLAYARSRWESCWDKHEEEWQANKILNPKGHKRRVLTDIRREFGVNQGEDTIMLSTSRLFEWPSD